MGFKKFIIWKEKERYTYIKGSFIGKYRGNLDISKLKSNYEKYYNIEVYEGEIYDFETEQNKPLEINEEKYLSFKSEVNFLQRRFENIISKPLNSLNPEFDEFKLKINGPKVKNIQISNIVKDGNQTFGTFTCIVFGYITDIISREKEEIEICETCNNLPLDCNCSLNATVNEQDSFIEDYNFSPPEMDDSSKSSLEIEGCLSILKGIGLLVFIGLGLAYYPSQTTFLLPFLFLVIGIYYYFKWQNKILALLNTYWNTLFKNKRSKNLKIFGIFLLIIGGIVYYGYSIYKQEENKRIEIERINFNKRQLKLKQEAVKKRQDSLIFIVKKDSSENYLKQANKDFERRRYSRALANLNKSLAIFPSNHEAQFRKGVSLRKIRKYNEAIITFDSLNSRTDEYKSEIYLEKGKCFLKLQKREEGLFQIYKSAQLNNNEAEKLYEKVNPIIKEIIGYVTRCCDGTISYSKGRGTCSHHGGVCNWNDPVYRERRKYSINQNR